MSLAPPVFNLVASLSAAAVVLWAWKSFLSRRPLSNIRGPEPLSWLKGNRPQMWHPTQGIKFMKAITEKYGGIVRLEGVFGAQELFVSDPLALQSISANDTSIWQMPAEVLATNTVLFGEGLPGTTGDIHRKHRKDLYPIFSKVHTRELLPVFYSVGKRVCNALSTKVESGPQEIDILPWVARIALELLGQGGLGYSFDNFADDQPDEYASAIKNLLPLLFRNPVPRAVAPYLPRSLRYFLASIAPSKPLQDLLQIARVLDKSSKKLLRSKRIAMENGQEGEQVGAGKDLMSNLLRGNLRGKEVKVIPDADLLGHINALVFGAVDTTSSALSRIFYVLAQNQHLQDRIRREVRATCEQFGAEDLTFDVLSEMPYLDAFCREILRLYAPVPAVLRCAVKDTILPLSSPIRGKDGREMKEVPVPAGTTVFASILMPNISTKIWGEDALQLKPERWLSPLPDTVLNSRIPGIYSHLMTFWAGQSACLGYPFFTIPRPMRRLMKVHSFQFGQLELKAIISLILKSFKLSLSDKDIVWHSSGLQFPSLVETGSLGLPIVVEAL